MGTGVNKRIPNLDLYRALAIMLVLYFHLSQMIFGRYFDDRNLFIIGKYGVNLFFVLSGFLVGGMYYRSKHVNVFSFWLKRFLRTYPPYIIALLCSWFAVWISRKEHFDIGYIFMIQNFYTALPYFLVSWSLCVEEHFYILFALLIFALEDKQNQKYVWIILAIAPSLVRFYFSNPYSNAFGYDITATYFQIDSIAMGVLAAHYIYEGSVKLEPTILLLIATSLLFIFMCYFILCFHNGYLWSFGTLIMNATASFLLLILYFLPDLHISKLFIFRNGARMAYSIYLVHPLCIHLTMLLFKKYDIQNSFLELITALLVVAVSSLAFYHLIEQPSIKLRNILIPHNKS